MESCKINQAVERREGEVISEWKLRLVDVEEFFQCLRPIEQQLSAVSRI